MRARYYCGYKDGRPEVFKATTEPTAASHGERYAAVVGPFRTKRAAAWMAEHGNGNPHARSVADAERLCRSGAEWTREPAGDGRYYVRAVKRDPLLPVSTSYRLPGVVIGGGRRWAAEVGGRTIGHYPTATAACRALFDASRQS